MRKRLLSVVMAGIMAFGSSLAVFGDVPRGTVVLDGKGYTLKYVNENLKDSKVMDNVEKAFIKVYDGKWIDVKNEKEISEKELPRVKYVDDEGSIWVYEKSDGNLIEELSDRAIMNVKMEKVQGGIGYKIKGRLTSEASKMGIYGNEIRILDKQGNSLTGELSIYDSMEEEYIYIPKGIDKVDIEVIAYGGEISCVLSDIDLKLGEGINEILAYESNMDKNMEIEVSNMDEFLKAIGSNRKIIMKKGVYNLLEKEVHGNYVSAYDSDYNSSFSISNVKNLVIEGEEVLYEGDEMIHGVKLQVQPRYMNVLTFFNCENVTLRNLNVGHTPEQGVCSGGVIRINEGNNFTIENSTLYGCGTEGIAMVDSNGLIVKNSVIEECSNGLAYFTGSEDIKFLNTKFRRTNGYYGFEITNSYNLEFKDCLFSDNGRISNDNMFKIENVKVDGKNNLTVKGCTFKNNKMKAIVNSNFEDAIILEDNKFENNKFD